MTRPLPPRVAAAALVVVLLVGLWPYFDVLGWLPWGGDSLKWVGRSSLDNPDWARWVFASKHFVGYRPVTGLTYTVNSAVPGYSPYVYRATDLLFYLLSSLALYGLYRRLTGDRSWVALVPLLLVMAHPATEEIVPYSSRRSYLMAATFGLAGLTVLADAARSWVRAVGGAVLLGLAVLSNEVAYVLVPLVPWVVGRSRGADRPWVRAALPKVLPTVVVVGGAVLARYVVLGTIGGYQRRIFAFVRKGTPLWQDLEEWRPLDILTAAWSHTVDPFGVTGRDPLLPGSLQGAFAVVVALWVAWVGLVRPLLRLREPGSQVALALTAWMVGSLAIVVLSQTWFWRQAHGVLIPLALLVALELKRALEAPRRWRQAPGLVSMGALAVAITWNGPLARGLHRGPHLNTIQGSGLAERMKPLLGRIDPGSTVYLVAPLRGTGGHVLRQWGDQLGVDQHLRFHLLAHLKVNGAFPTADVKVVQDGSAPDGASGAGGQRPRLFLGAGMMMGRARGMPDNPEPGDGFDVVRLWRSDTPTWLVALDVDDAWAIRVPQPPPGVPTLPDPGADAAPDDEGDPAE